jgi:DUF1680 family protein
VDGKVAKAMAHDRRDSTTVTANPQGAIQPFNYRSVRLRASFLRDQYQHMRDYFLAIPDDDMLKGFRERAGLPAPGQHLGGWYSGDDKGMFYSQGDWGNTFGQWLSAFARMASAAGDDAARDKALRLMGEWAKTIEPDGYFYFSRHPYWPTYTYDKMCGGLVDIAEYLECEAALRHLRTITNWAIRNLDRGHLEVPPRYSELNGEWYTLSENLYRAYQVTGDPMYRDFAQVWHYTSFWDALARGEDAFLFKHAYSHVNTLSSAAMAFAVTGERRYFDTIENAYRILRDHHLYATGGFGPEEGFVPPDGRMGRSVLNPHNWLAYRSNFETPCGSWAAFKLCRYLQHFTGAAHYGDWIELLVYNGIGAALPMAGRGKTFYYSDYMLTGGRKVYHPELWPCCSGTFPLAVADYHNLIYYRDADGLYVNLFIPSEVTWPQDGVQVRVVQETRFPEEAETLLTVHTTTPISFALRFRLPGWLAGNAAVSVNGQTTEVKGTKGEWAVLARQWNGGDQVRIKLPMQLAFVPVDAQHPHLAALTIGPVVLVADLGPRWPWEETLTGDIRDPASWIVPAGEPLTFRMRGPSRERTFRPFYKVGEGETYWMYLPFPQQ